MSSTKIHSFSHSWKISQLCSFINITRQTSPIYSPQPIYTSWLPILSPRCSQEALNPFGIDSSLALPMKI
eukprot:c43054_g1_i1 orf=4-213(+)